MSASGKGRSAVAAPAKGTEQKVPSPRTENAEAKKNLFGKLLTPDALDRERLADTE